jgi:hypothetical protein
MSDLPVLMEVAWPSLAEGCGERSCGAHFSSWRLSCFFSTFLLVGNIGGACVNGDALYVRLGQPAAIPC